MFPRSAGWWRIADSSHRGIGNKGSGSGVDLERAIVNGFDADFVEIEENRLAGFDRGDAVGFELIEQVRIGRPYSEIARANRLKAALFAIDFDDARRLVPVAKTTNELSVFDHAARKGERIFARS